MKSTYEFEIQPVSKVVNDVDQFIGIMATWVCAPKPEFFDLGELTSNLAVSGLPEIRTPFPYPVGKEHHCWWLGPHQHEPTEEEQSLARYGWRSGQEYAEAVSYRQGYIAIPDQVLELVQGWPGCPGSVELEPYHSVRLVVRFPGRIMPTKRWDGSIWEQVIQDSFQTELFMRGPDMHERGQVAWWNNKSLFRRETGRWKWDALLRMLRLGPDEKGWVRK